MPPRQLLMPFHQTASLLNFKIALTYLSPAEPSDTMGSEL